MTSWSDPELADEQLHELEQAESHLARVKDRVPVSDEAAVRKAEYIGRLEAGVQRLREQTRALLP